ncbi:MAG TPA: HTH domain-containing protein [Archangium sp.]|uniref:helix-turn-helix domain-containing protein n=1 Tax=Archangium sp. TaxID=1872627 RepID=UPI002E340AA9|nr:HTH domain-containing protein [Archangium sp.]HEX5750032.1 HTH domain-containing protein [Archangium sp.]
MRRPKTVTCACGAVLQVKPKGRLPWRCDECWWKHTLARQRGEPTPSRPAHLEPEARDSLGMGPERPELGMTEVEYVRWKVKRIVQLYRSETELSAQAIAERLGLSLSTVTNVLNRHGIHCRGDGRAVLAAGPPA